MDSMSFTLFGATGDLAKRKIYPALFNLYMDKKLPTIFSIIGVGKEKMSEKEFQSMVIESLYEFSRHSTNDKALKLEFVQSISYISLDLTNKSSYSLLLQYVKQKEMEKGINENRIFYLSVPPAFFEVITTNLKNSGLGHTKGWKRVIIEKPFGHDLASATHLNNMVKQAFFEEEIFRMDHYLGKPMVQNLETLISANPVLQSIWNNKLIANVQITASETVGVGGRAAYYEQAGAIRDMVQNHMLQLVLMSALRMSEKDSVVSLRNEKIKLMEAIQRIHTEKDIIRGQYRHLKTGDTTYTNGYLEEPGVNPSSTTDTFVAARLFINTPSWKGVPFFIRTGKRLARKETKIVVEFKNIRNETKAVEERRPNLLVITIQPDEGVSLHLNSKNPLTGEIEPIDVHFSSSNREIPEAYEYLLADAIKGNADFFTHWDEVELAWKWIQPVLEAFDNNQIPLHLYESGTNGPEASDQLLKKDGFHWW